MPRVALEPLTSWTQFLGIASPANSVALIAPRLTSVRNALPATTFIEGGATAHALETQ